MHEDGDIREKARRPLSGRSVLLSLLAFFGVVVGANAIMITLAIRTLPGTEVDSAYRAGLQFNSEIAAARAQAARDWQIAAQVERAPDGHTAIKVEARDARGAPLAGLGFAARLQRPADSRGDKQFDLVERENGIYRGAVEGVAAGQWVLVIEAERANQRMFLSRNRVVLE